jgi:hypothetical protein
MGSFSTVDLLVLVSLDQLLFILRMFVNLFTKQANLMRRSIVLSLSLQLVFPGQIHIMQQIIFFLARKEYLSKFNPNYYMNITTIYNLHKLEIICKRYSKFQAVFGLAWVEVGQLKTN